MRTILFVATVSAILFMSSCEKEIAGKTKNNCPIIDVSAVPNVVKDSFNARYPGMSVTTWFNKDNNSFCAYFVLDDGDKLAQFANDGNFITEQMLINEDIQSDDNIDDGSELVMDNKIIDTGCKCDISGAGN